MIICIFSLSSVFLYKQNKTDTYVFNINENNNLNKYIIDVVFDDESKRLMCNQEIEYVNNSNIELDKLYFHIYPNAFSKKEFAPFEESDMPNAYPNGFNEGYINIKKISSNNNNLKYNISGEKEDILEIELNEKINPKEKISINIDYNVKIPNSEGRFGYSDNTINITNWFPIACVYDENGWNTRSYEEIGDPFYSDISNFYLNLTLPKKYEIGTSGDIISEETDKEQTTYEIVAENIRDFAFVLSDKFVVHKDTYNDIEISTYNLNQNIAKEVTEISKKSIEIFSELFGQYPYKNYSVVASDFFIGGMEYPNMVMIDESLYNKEDTFLLEYVIAHETAHQWWYGVVGNNEITEPWIDEALTEYSTILYFEKKYGKELSEKLIENMNIQTRSYKVENIFKPTTEYENSIEYSLNVYTKGALAFNKIREKIGDELFFDTLKKYYETYMYENVNGAEFVKVWNDNGVDIDKIISELK